MERNGAFQINKWIQCNTAGLLPTISHLGISHTSTAYTWLSYHIIHVDVTEKYANENVNDRWMASWMDDKQQNPTHFDCIVYVTIFARTENDVSFEARKCVRSNQIVASVCYFLFMIHTIYWICRICKFHSVCVCANTWAALPQSPIGLQINFSWVSSGKWNSCLFLCKLNSHIFSCCTFQIPDNVVSG